MVNYFIRDEQGKRVVLNIPDSGDFNALSAEVKMLRSKVAELEQKIELGDGSSDDKIYFKKLVNLRYSEGRLEKSNNQKGFNTVGLLNKPIKESIVFKKGGNGYLMIGLSYVPEYEGAKDMDYSIYFSKQEFKVYEKGEFIKTVGRFSSKDEFEIKIEDNQVVLYGNSNPIFKWENKVEGSIYFDVSIYDGKSYLTDLQIDEKIPITF